MCIRDRCGVLPGMLREVLAKAVRERLATDIGHELLEDRCTFGVGDSVEVDLDVLEVANLGDDRVGRGQLVLAVGPGLLGGVEGGPGRVPLRGLGRAAVSYTH